MGLCETTCSLFFIFFFQAEDGIRDYKVTGVQTCALPILPTTKRSPTARSRSRSGPSGAAPCSRRSRCSTRSRRSEERRVGKECRPRNGAPREKQEESGQQQEEGETAEQWSNDMMRHDRC